MTSTNGIAKETKSIEKEKKPFIILPTYKDYIGVRRDVIINMRVDIDTLEEELKHCEKRCKSCSFWKTFSVITGTAVGTVLLIFIVSSLGNVRIEF